LLRIELVPQPTWHVNVRSRVSQDTWNRVRLMFLRDKCQICGFRGRLYCHEVWSYDDARHIQKLIGLEFLCELCHSVKHLGFVGVAAERGDVDYAEIVKHYCRVNGCSIEQFLRDREEAFRVFRERSQHEWTVDTSWFDGVLEESRRVREYIAKHPEVIERLLGESKGEGEG